MLLQKSLSVLPPLIDGCSLCSPVWPVEGDEQDRDTLPREPDQQSTRILMYLYKGGGLKSILALIGRSSLQEWLPSGEPDFSAVLTSVRSSDKAQILACSRGASVSSGLLEKCDGNAVLMQLIGE